MKIKPVRLLLLIAIVAAMYLQYVPLWIGIPIIVGYFLIKLIIGALITRLFSAPFKMKGKALAGASCTLHGFEWTDRPPINDEDEEDGEEVAEPLRYVWLDVTITPAQHDGGFQYWEPDELMLAPAKLKFNGLDSLEACYGVQDTRVDGVEPGSDDDVGKYEGPQRIRVLAGIPLDVNDFRFAYYFETFGEISLDAPEGP